MCIPSTTRCTSLLFILIFIKSHILFLHILFVLHILLFYCFALFFILLHILLFSYFFTYIYIYMLLCGVTLINYYYYFFLHCPLSGPDLTYISLLIIPCIIYHVTNKETLNLEPWNAHEVTLRAVLEMLFMYLCPHLVRRQMLLSPLLSLHFSVSCVSKQHYTFTYTEIRRTYRIHI